MWGTPHAALRPRSFGLGLGAVRPSLDAESPDTPPALSFSARSAGGDRVPPIAGLASRVLLDLGTLAVRPRHLDRRDWTRLALGTAAVGAAFALDNRVRSAVLEDSSASTRDFARGIRPLGTWGGLVIAGGLAAGGRLARDPEVAATGDDALEAVAIAAGVITPLLKSTVGRARPNTGKGHTSNDPLTGGQSFPSGDATEAFALASVVSAHTGSFWLRGASWGLAGLVAWDRIELDAHWASDVVAGALIGTAVGDWVVRHHHEDRTARDHLVVTPLIVPSEVGLEATLSW